MIRVRVRKQEELSAYLSRVVVHRSYVAGCVEEAAERIEEARREIVRAGGVLVDATMVFEPTSRPVRKAV